MASFGHVLCLTFLTVLGAEIGCFFRTAALVERFGTPVAVCAGTLLANLLLLVPLWVGGAWFHRLLSPLSARMISGAVLLLMGLLILWGKEL